MSPGMRFGAYWIGFAVLFVMLQLVIADERPDGFGVAVLIIGALPVAILLTWMESRRSS